MKSMLSCRKCKHDNSNRFSMQQYNQNNRSQYSNGITVTQTSTVSAPSPNECLFIVNSSIMRRQIVYLKRELAYKEFITNKACNNNNHLNHREWRRLQRIHADKFKRKVEIFMPTRDIENSLKMDTNFGCLSLDSRMKYVALAKKEINNVIQSGDEIMETIVNDPGLKNYESDNSMIDTSIQKTTTSHYEKLKAHKEMLRLIKTQYQSCKSSMLPRKHDIDDIDQQDADESDSSIHNHSIKRNYNTPQTSICKKSNNNFDHDMAQLLFKKKLSSNDINRFVFNNAGKFDEKATLLDFNVNNVRYRYDSFKKPPIYGSKRRQCVSSQMFTSNLMAIEEEKSSVYSKCHQAYKNVNNLDPCFKRSQSVFPNFLSPALKASKVTSRTPSFRRPYEDLVNLRTKSLKVLANALAKGKRQECY